jgi:NAD(P)-dependent dehydrogenase (short-subunit alcohol dehydrogenase family)
MGEYAAFNARVRFSGADLMVDRNSDLYSMEGKLCLVTGATAGIGQATADALAGMGAALFIHGRDEAKLDETKAWLAGRHPSLKARSFCADYEDLIQVQTMAHSIADQGRKIDVLVNNAGAFFNSRQSTQYGVEKTLLVNHLASFMLTTELLGKEVLKNNARIVMVTSDGHRMGSIDFEDLEYRKGYFGMKGYARSKLANLLFTYELDRRLRDSDITVNAVHPGHTVTDIWRTNFGVAGPALKWIMGLFGRSPEAGADTVVYLASRPELADVSGKYFADREMRASSQLSYDEELAFKLWQVSESIVQQYRS